MIKESKKLNKLLDKFISQNVDKNTMIVEKLSSHWMLHEESPDWEGFEIGVHLAEKANKLNTNIFKYEYNLCIYYFLGPLENLLDKINEKMGKLINFPIRECRAATVKESICYGGIQRMG